MLVIFLLFVLCFLIRRALLSLVLVIALVFLFFIIFLVRASVFVPFLAAFTFMNSIWCCCLCCCYSPPPPS